MVEMRELAILVAAVVAISAMTRDNVKSTLRPTEPMPAVNVP
jgi:hypothetical protein